MSMSRPIWHEKFAGVCIRIPLGLFFAIVGLSKLKNLEGFVNTVKQYEVLPDQFATLYGAGLPFMEVFVGCLLILGLWTVIAASLASLMLLSIIIAVGLFPTPEVSIYLLNKDVIFLGASLALLATGPGAFSVDGFRTSG